MAIFHLMRKDLVIPTKKQGAPRGKNAATVAKYAEQLRIVDEWPFPPLLVLAQTKHNKKDGTESPTGKWMVIGGGRRTAAANEVKWAKPIPAEVFEGKEMPEDKWGASAYVASVRDNMKHGDPFTESERDDSFRTLREMGMTVQEIANEWHVHKSTVSRSLAGKTTVASRGSKSETETETAEETGKKNSKGTQDVAHWCDFLKARFTDIYEYLSLDGNDPDNKESALVEETKALVLRLAEDLNA